VAWWSGKSLNKWSFKANGEAIDAECLGWYPLPEDEEGQK
jgi:hypothetical protein